jgi:ketosteroid isomerase-like protein
VARPDNLPKSLITGAPIVYYQTDMKQPSTVTLYKPTLFSRSPMTLRSCLLATVLFTLLAPALLPAQEPNPLHTASRQELNIIKVLVAQENAWNKGDLAGFTSSFKDSPDTLFITHQLFRGFAGLLDEYKHDYPNKAAMGTLTYSDLEVHPLDENFAVVVGKYHLERTKKDGGSADGLFSLVFENTDNGWKIVVDHTT